MQLPESIYVSHTSRDTVKMADEREEPPPFGNEGNIEQDPESDDLFTSTSEVRNM